MSTFTFGGFTYTIIPMPTDPLTPRTVDWSIANSIAVSTSPFTGQQQLQNWSSSWIEADLGYQALTTAQGPQWAAFLMACQGSGNIFQFGDPLLAAPQAGAGSGSMIVSGANQTGYTLSVTGWTGTLTAGDWLQIGFRLYRNLTTQTLSGSAATLSISPNIRESPADGASITLTNTKGVFRMKTNMQKWSQNQMKTYGVQFQIREAI